MTQAIRSTHREKKQGVLCATLCSALALLALCAAVNALLPLETQPVAAPQKLTVQKTQTTLIAAAAKPEPLADEPLLFIASGAAPIPKDYTFALASVGSTGFQMQPEAAQALERFLADGMATGLNLRLRSTYRSHEEQQGLFDRKMSGYLAQGLSEAEAWESTTYSIAAPGTSEHETGLAADIAAVDTGTLGPGFAETPEFAWLSTHCAEYGFILRYPAEKQDITGVYYEPWHYRYVGEEYAAQIMTQGVTLEEFVASNGGGSASVRAS